MEKIPFAREELIPRGRYSGMIPGAPGAPILSSPISPRENLRALVKDRAPLWVPHLSERTLFNPMLYPDCLARGFVHETQRADPSTYGGKDMFGVVWEYDPVSHGSMVRPGNPLVTDLEHWEDQVTFPDLDSWDWEGSARRNEQLCQGSEVLVFTLFSGLFERLISLVDMDNALVAMIDEDLQEAVHRLFDRLCLLYDDLFGRLKKWFDVDLIWFHDDWGSQRGPLMAPDTVREMLEPYLKRVVESAHRNGMLFELHCCGKNELLVPSMVAAGVDMWAGQPLNDKKMLTATYGDQMVFGVELDPVSPDASEEEVRANIRKLLDEYPEGTYFVSRHDGMHPLEYQILYEESRKRFLEA